MNLLQVLSEDAARRIPEAGPMALHEMCERSGDSLAWQYKQCDIFLDAISVEMAEAEAIEHMEYMPKVGEVYTLLGGAHCFYGRPNKPQLIAITDIRLTDWTEWTVGRRHVESNFNAMRLTNDGRMGSNSTDQVYKTLAQWSLLQDKWLRPASHILLADGYSMEDVERVDKLIPFVVDRIEGGEFLGRNLLRGLAQKSRKAAT
jgi:hypothetical protein